MTRPCILALLVLQAASPFIGVREHKSVSTERGAVNMSTHKSNERAALPPKSAELIRRELGQMLTTARNDQGRLPRVSCYPDSTECSFGVGGSSDIAFAPGTTVGWAVAENGLVAGTTDGATWKTALDAGGDHYWCVIYCASQRAQDSSEHTLCDRRRWDWGWGPPCLPFSIPPWLHMHLCAC